LTDTLDSPTTDPDDLLVTLAGEIPEFEGRIPIGVLTNVQGASQRIGRAIHHEEKVVLVVEASVRSVDHPMTKDGLKRRQVLKVEDIYEMEGKRGHRLLSTLRTAWRQADDARHARTPIEGLFDGVDGGATGATDGSGVVLTGSELAELGLADESLDPVMVVFSDGGAKLWPDDFSDGDPRPAPGEECSVDDGTLDVVRLVDPTSGDLVAGWTDDEYQAHLVGLEEIEAAKEDRAAADELEAARAPLSDGQLANRQPFDEYDQADAKLITLWLAEDCDTLEQATHVAVYEAAHKARKTVIAAAQARHAELTEAAS
jgi:hypothetical protein